MNKIHTHLPAIVIVAYNRTISLERILNAIAKANYPRDEINLIISIDRGEHNKDVLQIAQNFVWQHGNKIVKYQDYNLGLKAHILKCMAFAEEFGSIIMLEDDLFVSSNFYNYSIKALNFSEDKEYIAGISLYNHQMNVHTSQNFSPIEDGYDNWYFQFASSWGQAWSKSQIRLFLEWYSTNPIISEMINVPLGVRVWSDKSWLKYFISYVVEKDKYFLYPKISLTTNFGDEGEHITSANTEFQVPLSFGKIIDYNFSTIQSSSSVYDSFFENEKLNKHLNLVNDELTVDLYGYKTDEKNRFFLSSQILNYNILKSFNKSLKPLDANIIYNIKGEDFFLYDTKMPKKNSNKINRYRNLKYNIKVITFYDALVILKNTFLIKLSEVFRK